MTKRCKKRGYRDEIAAKLVLAAVQRADKATRPKVEQRPYWCPRCRKWHLTSRA